MERTLILLLLAFYPDLLTISYPNELRLFPVAHEQSTQVLVTQEEQYNSAFFRIVGPDGTEMDGGVVRSTSDVISTAAFITDDKKVNNISPRPMLSRYVCVWHGRLQLAKRELKLAQDAQPWQISNISINGISVTPMLCSN